MPSTTLAVSKDRFWFTTISLKVRGINKNELIFFFQDLGHTNKQLIQLFWEVWSDAFTFPCKSWMSGMCISSFYWTLKEHKCFRKCSKCGQLSIAIIHSEGFKKWLSEVLVFTANYLSWQDKCNLLNVSWFLLGWWINLFVCLISCWVIIYLFLAREKWWC